MEGDLGAELLEVALEAEGADEEPRTGIPADPNGAEVLRSGRLRAQKRPIGRLGRQLPELTRIGRNPQDPIRIGLHIISKRVEVKLIYFLKNNLK